MTTTKRQIEKMIKDYAVKEDNVFLAERLFVANTVLNWAFNNNKDEKMLKIYIGQVERHLAGEITLYWDGNVIKVKKDERRSK